jgi:PAS domain S-box-containing protein
MSSSEKAGRAGDSVLQDLEAIAALAANVCNVSSSAVVLRRGEKLSMEACYHADVHEIDSADPLWLQTIRAKGVLSDGNLNDVRVSFSSGGAHPRCFAGASLTDSQGGILGLLAVFDTVAHSFSEKEKNGLAGLSRLAGVHLELRLALLQTKGTEELLRTQQEEYVRIVDSSSDIICEISAGGKIILCNPAFGKLLGCEDAELSNHSYLDFVHPDSRQAAQRFYDDQLLRKTPTSYYEMPVLAKDGAIKWIGQNTRLLEEKGRVKGFALVAHEITERKNFEAALLEGRQRFQTIFEAAAEGIYMTDPGNKRILESNTAFASMVEYSPDQLLNLSVYDLVIDSPEHIDQRMEGLIHLHAPVRAERQYRTRTGKVIDVEAAVSVVRLNGKEVLVTIVHDVTARKRAEAELLASEQRFQDLFRKIPLPAWVCDLETLKFMEVNDEASKQYGYTREEFSNMRITDIRPNDAMSQMRAALELIQTRQSTEMETQHRCKDGHIIDVETSWHEFHFGRRKALLVVAHDITEIKRTQLEIQEAKESAEKANTAKSEFLSNMSHEVRTPMNGILGTIQLFSQSQLTEEQRQYMDAIQVSGDALLKIINDILDFSKLESGALEAKNSNLLFDRFIEETYEIVAIQAEKKGLELQYWIDENVPSVVLTDATRLRQILLNLVSNAVKFTEHGGVTVVVTRGVEKSGRMELLFSVKDSGVGIAPDQADRLFKPFSQIDASSTRKYGGVGLGLALCARSVDLLGGKIWLESEEGTGSTFRFSVRTGNPSDTPGAKSKTDEFSGRRILFVSDNGTQIQIVEKLLTLWGCKVECARTVQRALECAAREPMYDCIILNHMLDDISGGAVLDDIRKSGKQKHAKAVALVPHGKYTIPSDAETTILLTKPVRHMQLYETLKKIFSNEKIAPPVRTEESQKPPPAVSDLKVLVAEDNNINQKLISRILKSLGYASEIVENGKEALAKVQAGRYDLVFMDVQMPEMDGYEASRQIVRMVPKDRRPVIIAMTAHALQGDRELCLEAGMDDYLSKPILIDDVRRCLEKWNGILNGEKK